MSDVKIFGFDLSKESTGVCMFTLERETLKLTGTQAIQIPHQSFYTKNHFIAVSKIIDRIEELFVEHCVDVCPTTVCFEYPVFSSYSSELTFYLTQEFLKLCEKFRLNTVGYSPMMLKKFIALCHKSKMSTRQCDKNVIAKIYKESIVPYNSGYPKLETDDEADAFFLCLLASIAQVPFLKTSKNISKESLSSLDIFLDSKEAGECFFNGRDHYKEVYSSKACDKKNYDGFVIDQNRGIPFEVQFKAVIERLKKNGHLSLKSSMFFPFAEMKKLEYVFWHYATHERDLMFEYLRREFFIGNKPVVNVRIFKDIINRGRIPKISFNKKGQLFFVI